MWDISNKPLNLKILLDGFQRKLADLIEVFAKSTTFGYINEFVHFDDLVTLSGVPRGSATRRLQSLGSGFSKIENDCRYHPSSACNMVEQNVAFLLFLSWMEIPGTEEHETDTIKDIPNETISGTVADADVEEQVC